MFLRPAEFTHASDKFEFTTKEFGASGAGRSLRVGWAAVANQLAAAWMWLAGVMPLSTVHSNWLLYFSVILRNTWFSLGNNKCFWKENENLYFENHWQCFRKNDEGGLFPLKPAVPLLATRWTYAQVQRRRLWQILGDQLSIFSASKTSTYTGVLNRP